jgi:hypothetical protein
MLLTYYINYCSASSAVNLGQFSVAASSSTSFSDWLVMPSSLVGTSCGQAFPSPSLFVAQSNRCKSPLGTCSGQETLQSVLQNTVLPFTSSSIVSATLSSGSITVIPNIDIQLRADYDTSVLSFMEPYISYTGNTSMVIIDSNLVNATITFYVQNSGTASGNFNLQLNCPFDPISTVTVTSAPSFSNIDSNQIVGFVVQLESRVDNVNAFHQLKCGILITITPLPMWSTNGKTFTAPVNITTWYGRLQDPCTAGKFIEHVIVMSIPHLSW